MEEWYYALGGQQRGPVTLEILKKLTSNGKLSRNDMVWREGMPDWKKAGQIDDLFPRAESARGESSRGESARGSGTEIVDSARRKPTVAAAEVVDDEEFNDRPRKKKKKRQESSPGAMAAIIGSSVGGGLLILIVVIVLLVRAGQNRNPPPVVAMPAGGQVGVQIEGGPPPPAGVAAVQPVTYNITLREGQENSRAFTFQQGQRVEILVRTPQGLLRNPDVDLFVNRLNGQDFEVFDDAISKDCLVQFVAPATDQYTVLVVNLGPGTANSTVTIR